MISKCKGDDLFNILNSFSSSFYFSVEEFVSFEMYFLKCDKGFDSLRQTRYWSRNGYSYFFLIFNRRLMELGDMSGKVIHASHDLLM